MKHSIAILFLFILFSCNDSSLVNDDLSLVDKNTIEEGIMVFSTYEDYAEMLLKTVNFTPEEQVAFEELNGYKSFGRICDEYYDEFLAQDFSNSDEIESYIAERSKYLTIVKDQNGELNLETTAHNCRQQYIMNKDGMFQVGNQTIKIIDNVSISTDISRKDILLAINAANVDEYRENEHFKVFDGMKKSLNSTLKYSESCQYDIGEFADDATDNTYRRVLVDINCNPDLVDPITGLPFGVVQGYVTNQIRILGIIWVKNKHTVLVTWKIKIVYWDYQINDWNYKTADYSGSWYTRSTKYYEFGYNPGQPVDMYIEDYKIGAKQAGLPDDDSPCVGTFDCYAKIDCDDSDTYGEWD